MNRIAASGTTFLSMIVVVASVTVAGCHAAEPTSPDVGLTKAVAPPKMPDEGHGASRVETDQLYTVFVGDALAHTCSGPAPFFQFDSSDPKKDQPTMQMLTNCMIDGPLKGKTIKLIGHTDPRGTPNYNDKLGLERAGRVQRYLLSHGVDSSRVQIDSMGAESASGNPADFKTDRRVEIQLVP